MGFLNSAIIIVLFIFAIIGIIATIKFFMDHIKNPEK